MTLIADSGSTKTTWVDIESGNKTVTEGLNPHFTSDEQYLSACGTVSKLLGQADAVFFYGAGCGDEVQRAHTTQLLRKGFRTENVCVETDLLGACRAVSRNEASIVGILGTGSNACYFNGSSIIHRSPSLGFLLGDEGSANHLGRVMLGDYMKEKMSDRLKTLFHEAYPYSYAEWMDHIYHQPNPNRFLASLARFTVDHININECADNIWYVISQWHAEQLRPLVMLADCCKLNVVGSFGKAIETPLRDTLTEYGMEVGTIVADPVEGLREFHLQTL